MENSKSYCELVGQMEKGNIHREYHDYCYGFPIKDDNELFARLVLEINQAGLSWETILKKEKNFRKAFKNFDIKKVASFKKSDKQRLLSDAGIIRNRLKIDAVIYNAKVIIQIQKDFGSFKEWLDNNYPMTREEWTKLFKKTFKFTGGEIVNEFLLSSGYLPGAHIESCQIQTKIIEAKPAWLKL